MNFWFRGSEIDSLKFGIKEKDTTKTYTIQLKDIKPDSLVISAITKNSIELIDSFKIQFYNYRLAKDQMLMLTGHNFYLNML